MIYTNLDEARAAKAASVAKARELESRAIEGEGPTSTEAEEVRHERWIKENTLVVTRHAGLVDYIKEEFIYPAYLASDVVFSHVEQKDVEGKHVVGILPLHLAALADKVTVIPLNLTPADRGQELSAERVREVAGDPVTYRVEQVN
jgi:putative CRISPR-associated protein (TIGR02620 family)